MAGDLEVDVVIRCNALCKPPTAWASLHRLLLHSHGSCVFVLKVRLAKATTDLLTILPVLGMESVAKHTAARCKTCLCARIVICSAHGRAHWHCNDLWRGRSRAVASRAKRAVGFACTRAVQCGHGALHPSRQKRTKNCMWITRGGTARAARPQWLANPTLKSAVGYQSALWVFGC